jgi:hypothetical protein
MSERRAPAPSTSRFTAGYCRNSTSKRARRCRVRELVSNLSGLCAAGGDVFGRTSHDRNLAPIPTDCRKQSGVVCRGNTKDHPNPPVRVRNSHREGGRRQLRAPNRKQILARRKSGAPQAGPRDRRGPALGAESPQHDPPQGGERWDEQATLRTGPAAPPNAPPN